MLPGANCLGCEHLSAPNNLQSPLQGQQSGISIQICQLLRIYACAAAPAVLCSETELL